MLRDRTDGTTTQTDFDDHKGDLSSQSKLQVDILSCYERGSEQKASCQEAAQSL